MGYNSKYTGAQVEEILDNTKIYSANDIMTKLQTIDGEGSGLDADLLDGVQESGFCRHIDGVPITSHRGIGYGYEGQGWISSGPALSVGYSGDNYLMQLQAPADYTALHFRNRMNGTWGSWKQIAFTDSNVESATKLQTARIIWGQSFDGTGNVSGALSDVTGITFKNDYYGLVIDEFGNFSFKKPYSTTAVDWSFKDSSGNKLMIVNNYGSVGIGTSSPAYKLDVNGGIHASGSVTQNSDINLKNISKDVLISLDDISEAPLFEFTYKNDKNKRIHVGTSAQYWVEKNNWFCKKQDNGYYDMEIQNLALASAISIAKEFKKYKEETESIISSMKKEIEEFKQIILNMNK